MNYIYQRSVQIWLLLVQTLLMDMFFHCIHGVESLSSNPLRLTIDPPANQVQLNAPVRVRCNLDGQLSNGNSRLSMFLHCPISPWDNFCFQNCESACVSEEAGQCPFEHQLDPVNCNITVQKDGRVTYEYVIPKLNQDWLSDNGFYCKIGAHRTDEVRLQLGVWPESETTEPTTTKPLIVAPVTRVRTPQPENIPNVKPGSKDMEEKDGISPNNEREADEIEVKMSAILRELLIVCAIVIVLISLTINVICCIRCALIRQYSKTKRPARMQHIFCMSEEIQTARFNSQTIEDSNSTKGPGAALSVAHLQSGHTAHNSLNYPPQTARYSTFIDAYGQPHLVTSGPATLFEEPHSIPSNMVEDIANSRLLNTGFPNPRLERSSKTSSILGMLPSQHASEYHPGAPNSNIVAAINDYVAQQQNNLLELQQRVVCSREPSQTNSQTAGSDGLGSCIGSLAGVTESIGSGPQTIDLMTLRKAHLLNSSDSIGVKGQRVHPTHSMSQPMHMNAGLEQQSMMTQSQSSTNTACVYPGADVKQSDSGTASGSDRMSINSPNLLMSGSNAETSGTMPSSVPLASLSGLKLSDRNHSTTENQSHGVPVMSMYKMSDNLCMVNGFPVPGKHGELGNWSTGFWDKTLITGNSIPNNSPHSPIRNGHDRLIGVPVEHS